MYELYLYIVISVVFESGGGMLYGVAVGFDPLFVFATTLTINLLTVFASIFVIDKLLAWRKGLRAWLEKRTARGQRLINKYAVVGIIAGVFVLSPMQVAVIGRLLGIHSSKYYVPLVGGTILSAVVSMGIALGIFKLILHW
jgi:NADH:ubiquinone oxidoreductase subunit 3 (subunit A)